MLTRHTDIATVLHPAIAGGTGTGVVRRRTPLLGVVARWRVDTSRRGHCSTTSALAAPLSPRTLDGVLGHLDNFSPTALVTVGALGQCSVDRGERCKHGLVQLGLVRVNGGCVLAQVVETRKRLAAVAREGTLASVLAAG